MSRKSEPLYLLDGYSLIYRSYFAFINRPLVNSRGENTSVLFGFFRTLFSIIDKYNVTYLGVAMDSPVPTFRHEAYPQYKATREKAPDDLRAQIPGVFEILAAMGVPVIRKDRYEADDIIACLASECSRAGRDCFIISGDKDLLQLVDSRVKIIKPDKDGYGEIGPAEVEALWGVRPDQIRDYLALTGDTADNVPGVRGIGPKTAQGLLGAYGDLGGIYAHLDAVPAGQKKKLEEDRENALLSRDLVTLDCGMDLGITPEDLELKNFSRERAQPLFEAQELRSLVKQVRGEAEGRPAGDGGKGAGKDGAGFLDFSPPDAGAGAGASGASGAPGTPGTTAAPGGSGDRGRAGGAGGSWPVPPAPETRNYSAILSIEELKACLAACRKNQVFAFDCETDGLDELEAGLVGVSLSCRAGEGYYIPIKAPDAGCLSWEEAGPPLKALLEDPKVKVVGQNIKFDYKVMKRRGVEIRNIAFDTMTAAWLLDSQWGQYGMDALALRYLGVETIPYGDVVAKGQTFDQVPLEKAVPYAAEDADITFRLYLLFKDLLAREKLEKLFYDLELPLVKILAEMEYRGIEIKGEILRDYGRELAERLGEIEGEIYELCGREFNINSPKQLQVVLFEERKLPPGKKTKTGYSTDVAVLEELAADDPVPALILRHRGLAKIKSTYADALPEMTDPRTGRIHTRFIQTGTATGRMSSKDPNLQNIPIKTEDGRRIRSAFVPAAGCLFLSADYSQIELVVLAHLSGDPALSQAFRDRQDVHRQTAALIFDCPPEEVTPDQRRIAKTINFGVMYGMSSFRLSRELQIPRARADSFIASYFQRYGGIRAYMDKVIREAEETGVSTTILGRHREIRGINSRNKTEKAAAERVAVNSPIQGSAADIMKLGMLGVSRRLETEKLESRILLQVHDELLLEVPREEIDRASALVKEEMEAAYKLNVPLKVSVETGKNWGDLH